jgi:hypothetical protein
VPVLVAKTVKCAGLKNTSKEIGSDLQTMCRIRNSATRFPESTRPNDHSRLLLSHTGNSDVTRLGKGCRPLALNQKEFHESDDVP